MPGYQKLGYKSTDALLKKKLNIKEPSRKEPSIHDKRLSTLFEGNKEAPLGYSYYTISDNPNIIVIPEPVNANEFQNLLGKLQGNDRIGTCHVLCGLVGQGITENHIVTVDISIGQNGGNIQIIDSKYSILPVFLKSEKAISLGNHSLFESVSYISLGTQSLLDSVSCGYHHVKNLLACVDLLKQNQPITQENLLNNTKNSITALSEFIENEEDLDTYKDKIDTNFTSFIKQAWKNTFPTIENKPNFVDVLGWPRQKAERLKVIYFLTLQFIFEPLKSLIKVPTEFAFNALSETVNYFRNKLIAWAPTSPSAQYLRSGLMLAAYGFQYLFKGVALAARAIITPIVSYQEAKKVHPILGFISLGFSAIVYTALLFFVAPIAVHGILSIVPSLTSAFTAIGALIALLGVNLTFTPVITAISSALAVIGIKITWDYAITKTTHVVAQKIHYNELFNSYSTIRNQLNDNEQEQTVISWEDEDDMSVIIDPKENPAPEQLTDHQNKNEQKQTVISSEDDMSEMIDPEEDTTPEQQGSTPR